MKRAATSGLKNALLQMNELCKVNLKANVRIKRPIYMDNLATTPIDPRVMDKMLPYMSNKFGNPHSRNHEYGFQSEAAVEVARGHVARVINADPKEIVFTSGATEANNIAIKGCAEFYRKGSVPRNHIITVQTEHSCVLDACRHLEESGFHVTYLPVSSCGNISLDDLKAAIRPETLLVSVMFVNNEIGTVQPLRKIGQLCRERNIFFHTDAAQGFGKINLDVKDMNIDLLSISGHKIYGPKGIGALYVRRRPRVRLTPLFNGGRQERGIRSGTIPTHLAVGFGEASRISVEEMNDDYNFVKDLSSYLKAEIESNIEDVHFNGDKHKGYPGCVNYSFSCIEGESLMTKVNSVAFSSGSACTSASLEPSYVLRALGVGEDLAHCSARFGIGKMNTRAECKFVVEQLRQAVVELRGMSPLWDMKRDGIDINSIKWC
ncbi:MAG: cysteine desulfurase [Marteilia pararefringens]